MTTVRIITAFTAIAISGMFFVGCTPTPTPTSSSATPTPSPTSGAIVPPPTSEDDATAAADTVLTQYFVARGEVNAAGGTDTAPLEKVSTGRALEVALDGANRIANGPILNEDNVSVEGPSTTEGRFAYETIAVYAQDWNGTNNGLVTINACQDASGYKVTTADGKPALVDPNNARLVYDYQVIYDADKQAWLVYDLINTGATC